MNLRLFDAQRATTSPSFGARDSLQSRGRPSRVAIFGAPEANAELHARGRLDACSAISSSSTKMATCASIGRTDDIIIRGGKNLSAAAIEEKA